MSDGSGPSAAERNLRYLQQLRSIGHRSAAALLAIDVVAIVGIGTADPEARADLTLAMLAFAVALPLLLAGYYTKVATDDEAVGEYTARRAWDVELWVALASWIAMGIGVVALVLTLGILPIAGLVISSVVAVFIVLRWTAEVRRGMELDEALDDEQKDEGQGRSTG
jgi:hypothetical protein